MTAWTDSMAAGVAEYLAAAGAGAWSPDAPYTGTEPAPAIFLGPLPDEPDAAISIRVRPLAPANGVTTVGVQVVVRNPDNLAGAAQAIVDALHDLKWATLSTRIPHMWLQSWGDDLTDAAGVPVVSLNFYTVAAFTTPNTTD